MVGRVLGRGAGGRCEGGCEEGFRGVLREERAGVGRCEAARVKGAPEKAWEYFIGGKRVLLQLPGPQPGGDSGLPIRIVCFGILWGKSLRAVGHVTHQKKSEGLNRCLGIQVEDGHWGSRQPIENTAAESVLGADNAINV